MGRAWHLLPYVGFSIIVAGVAVLFIDVEWGKTVIILGAVPSAIHAIWQERQTPPKPSQYERWRGD